MERTVLNGYLKEHYDIVAADSGTKAISIPEKELDNMTAEQIELKRLQKEILQLKMENDILKQAALIFGRK